MLDEISIAELVALAYNPDTRCFICRRDIQFDCTCHGVHVWKDNEEHQLWHFQRQYIVDWRLEKKREREERERAERIEEDLQFRLRQEKEWREYLQSDEHKAEQKRKHDEILAMFTAKKNVQQDENMEPEKKGPRRKSSKNKR